MAKYSIKIKRDWGPYGWWNSELRKSCRTGFVVTKGGCNVMPGAIWFKTIAEAFRAIEILERVGDDAFHFWQEMRKETA